MGASEGVTNRASAGGSTENSFNLTASWHTGIKTEVSIPIHALKALEVEVSRTLSPDLGRAFSRTADLILPQAENGTLLLARNRDPLQGYTRSFSPARHLWKLDLDLFESGTGSQGPATRRVLSGFVTDRATGQPVSGVTVGVNGKESTLSRDDGSFDVVDVEWLEGPNLVALWRIGYQPWAQDGLGGRAGTAGAPYR